ncbi:hypothetical protein MLD38_017149 [Melastoma candidum]|uniref:Uncharacterized protein n=1 Tax=Melastoma candidum TaxID=119954 RepID=A0ACB9QPL7_9MYRT|nr:hypothetical protein MLD38_017149 [Melastoma candidum]
MGHPFFMGFQTLSLLPLMPQGYMLQAHHVQFAYGIEGEGYLHVSSYSLTRRNLLTVLNFAAIIRSYLELVIGG